MSIVRLIRMTIAGGVYDSDAGFARLYEMHMKVARSGSVRANRRALARRGVPYFQTAIYRRYRKWIPLRKIRVSWEREEQAAAVQRAVEVYGRIMRRRGKMWKATALPTTVISYTKRRRRRAKKKYA